MNAAASVGSQIKSGENLADHSQDFLFLPSSSNAIASVEIQRSSILSLVSISKEVLGIKKCLLSKRREKLIAPKPYAESKSTGVSSTIYTASKSTSIALLSYAALISTGAASEKEYPFPMNITKVSVSEEVIPIKKHLLSNHSAYPPSIQLEIT